MSRYQKSKTNLDFTETRDSEWQWHQLGHMQVCTSLETDNHASTPPLCFLQAGRQRQWNEMRKRQTRTKVSVMVHSRLKQASNIESEALRPCCISVSRTTLSIFCTCTTITNCSSSAVTTIRGVVLKRSGGTPETRLRQRCLNNLALHTRTLIHVRKIATADLWSCPAIQLLVFECL